MKNLIIKIRKKPKEVKNKIAFTVASVFTFIVFSFWAYNLPIKNNAGTISQNPDVATKEEGVFSGFFDGLSDQIATVKESVKELESEAELNLPSSTPTEILNDTVKTYRSSSTVTSSTSSAREVRIVTIKSTTSTSSLEVE